jgi:hypothetical protein
MLSDAGRKLYVHTIITGGQALGDTLKGFKSLADSSAERNIVVWLNEYFGVIERDGKTFTDMQAYKESESKVFGLVRIPKRNPDTFGRDVEEVITRKRTFEDAIRNGTATVMSKQRLKMVQRDLFEQLDQMSLCKEKPYARHETNDQRSRAENGIRIEPGDPLFALVTMNRMVFEESAQRYYDHNQQLIRGIQGVDEEGRNACREHARPDGEGISGEDAGGSAGRYSHRRPEGTRIRTSGERGPPSSCNCTLGLRRVSGCRSDIRLRRVVWTLFPLI